MRLAASLTAESHSSNSSFLLFQYANSSVSAFIMAPWLEVCPAQGIRHADFYSDFAFCQLCKADNPDPPMGRQMRASTVLPPDRRTESQLRDLQRDPTNYALNSFSGMSMPAVANTARQDGFRPRASATSVPNASSRALSRAAPHSQRTHPPLNLQSQNKGIEIRTLITLWKQAFTTRWNRKNGTLWHWKAPEEISSWPCSFYSKMYDTFVTEYCSSVSNEASLLYFILDRCRETELRQPETWKDYYGHSLCTGFINQSDEPQKPSLREDKEYPLDEMLIQFPIGGPAGPRGRSIGIVVLLGKPPREHLPRVEQSPLQQMPERSTTIPTASPSKNSQTRNLPSRSRSLSNALPSVEDIGRTVVKREKQWNDQLVSRPRSRLYRQ